jgi:DNA-binding IclR family transcriptional regulator
VAGTEVASIRRASQLLDQFSFAEPVLGVTELARRLGTSKGTVHRLVSTLVQEGLLSRTSTGRYRLGLRLYELGQQAVMAQELREIGHRYVEALRQSSGETSHLAVLDGTDAVYLEQLEDPKSFEQMASFGHRLPAYASSCGKCLLAFAPPDVLEAVLQRGFKRRLASRTIASPAALMSALDAVRERGYATSYEESWPGLASVAAPVLGSDGRAVAALSVAAVSSVMTDARLRRCASLVKEAGRRMTEELLRPRALRE